VSRANDAAQEIEVLVALLAEAVRLGDDRAVSILWGSRSWPPMVSSGFMLLVRTR
jgi:hypothetical protein